MRFTHIDVNLGNGAHLLDTFKLKPPQPVTGLFFTLQLCIAYIHAKTYSKKHKCHNFIISARFRKTELPHGRGGSEP